MKRENSNGEEEIHYSRLIRGKETKNKEKNGYVRQDQEYVKIRNRIESYKDNVVLMLKKKMVTLKVLKEREILMKSEEIKSNQVIIKNSECSC